MSEAMEQAATETGAEVVEQPAAVVPDIPDEILQAAIAARLDELIAAEVTKRLAGKPPKKNTVDPTAADKAAFKKMGYKERLQLFKSNPLTYQKLSGGKI